MAGNKNSREHATKSSRSSDKVKVAAAGAAAVGAGVAAKYAKKNPAGVIIVVLCLILGIVLGYFFAARTTGYTMVGEDYVALNMYSDYEEQGAKLQILGKDCSADIAISYFYREDISYDATACNGVDTSAAGFYYAVYSSDMFLYRDVQLIRTVEVMRVEDDGEK